MLNQMLNAAGYGAPGSGLILDLVYNPGGVFLAPPQAALEQAYKQVCVCVGVRALVCACARWPIPRASRAWQPFVPHPPTHSHHLPTHPPHTSCSGAGRGLWHCLQLPLLPQQHAHQALG